MTEYPLKPPVDEGILDRLSALLSRLGLPITITIGYAIVRETTTCTAVGLKNLLQEGVQQYEIYPALAATNRILSNATNIFQIIRHGVIIRTKEGNYYYIGGKSNYWAGGRSFHAYQGSTEFTLNPQGKEDSPIWQKIREANSNIIVLQVKTTRLSTQWVNPKPPEDCQSFIVGPLLNWIESQGRGAIITNYTPRFTIFSNFDTKIPGLFVYKSGGKLTADPLLTIMRSVSLTPPYPYFAILTPIPPSITAVPPNIYDIARILFTVFPASLDKDLCEFILIGSQTMCNYLASDSSYKEMLVGSPVFSAYSCPSGCKSVGLVGFVYSINENLAEQLSHNNFPLASLFFVPGPSTVNGEYTDQSIEEYANLLGVGDLLSLSRRYASSAKRAESEIITALGLSAAIAVAIISLVEWYEDWQKTYDEAKKYAEVAKNVVERIRNYLNSSRQYELLSYVDECVANSIGELGEESLNEDELYDSSLKCVLEHRIRGYPTIE